MSNVFIHIGTHKTGTTTIQHALRQAALREGGRSWHYIRTPQAAKGMMRATTYDAELVRSFRRDFLQYSKGIGEGKAILSTEALSGWPGAGYQNTNVVAPMLREATAGHNVKIIIYLRRQDDFVESMYTQTIHQGESISFDDFLKGFVAPGALVYSRIINDFVEHFGQDNVLVRSYHAASQKGLLGDFGELVDIPMLSETEQERKNPSYSRHALEIAKLSNIELDVQQKWQLRKALQKTMAKCRGESFSLFSDAERNTFLQRFLEDNQCIADRYFEGNVDVAFPHMAKKLHSISEMPMSHNQVSHLAVELLSQSNPRSSGKGLVAGARVALAGYPRLAKFVRIFLRRG